MTIPVMSCTNGLFTLDEVVFKPKSLEDYQRMLENPNSVIESFKRESSQRKKKGCEYAYGLLTESVWRFSLMMFQNKIKMDYACSGSSAALSPDLHKL